MPTAGSSSTTSTCDFVSFSAIFSRRPRRAATISESRARSPDRQTDADRRAPGLSCVQRDVAAVRHRDALHERQTEAGAAGLGGEEVVEGALAGAGVHAG